MRQTSDAMFERRRVRRRIAVRRGVRPMIVGLARLGWRLGSVSVVKVVGVGLVVPQPLCEVNDRAADVLVRHLVRERVQERQ